MEPYLAWCIPSVFRVLLIESSQLRKFPHRLTKADRKPCPFVNIKIWTVSCHSPASHRRCGNLCQEITPETCNLTNLIVSPMSCIFFVAFIFFTYIQLLCLPAHPSTGSQVWNNQRPFIEKWQKNDLITSDMHGRINGRKMCWEMACNFKWHWYSVLMCVWLAWKCEVYSVK